MSYFWTKRMQADARRAAEALDRMVRAIDGAPLRDCPRERAYWFGVLGLDLPAAVGAAGHDPGDEDRER